MKTVREVCAKYDELFRKADLIAAHECAADVIGKTILIEICSTVSEDGSIDPHGNAEFVGGTIRGIDAWSDAQARHLFLRTDAYRVEGKGTLQIQATWGTEEPDVQWLICDLGSVEFWKGSDGQSSFPTIAIGSIAIR
jgi:hypothetical protein